MKRRREMGEATGDQQDRDIEIVEEAGGQFCRETEGEKTGE